MNRKHQSLDEDWVLGEEKKRVLQYLCAGPPGKVLVDNRNHKPSLVGRGHQPLLRVEKENSERTAREVFESPKDGRTEWSGEPQEGPSQTPSIEESKLLKRKNRSPRKRKV